MASFSRQPARLMKLTSIQIGQHALPSSPNKRTAELLEANDDSENLEPSLFSKQTKASDHLPKAVTQTPSVAPSLFAAKTGEAARLAPSPSGLLRFTVESNSSIARFKTGSTAHVLPSLSRFTPADRSTTREFKYFGLRPDGEPTRIDPPQANLVPFSLDAVLKGIIPTYGRTLAQLADEASVFGDADELGNKVSSHFDIQEDKPEADVARSHVGSTQVDPPRFSLAPFSLDAAIKGTIPTYGRPLAQLADEASVFSDADERGSNLSWYFDIHEDTPEQEAANLIQHSTHGLDIDSDDEENVSPAGSASQNSPLLRRVLDEDSMVMEESRSPLMELSTPDFSAVDCDESAFKAEGASCAQMAVLEPMEGTGEPFEIWESESAKGDTSAPASPRLVSEDVFAMSF